MENENIIHIREPFYTAGKLYHWDGKSIGIGVNLRLLSANNGNDKLFVRVGDSGKVWQIEKAIALEFIKKYNSYFDARGTKLGVIAWYMFSSTEDIEEFQKSLF